jgi:hypothetical protein
MKVTLALLFCATVAGSAHAEVYQWTDEKGRTHFGETVPEKYQKSATLKDTGKINLMKAQKVQPLAPLPPAPTVAAPAGGPNRLPPAADRGSPLPPTPEQGCQQEIQRYQDSQACFARFRNANGSVRPEAFQDCPQVAAPECATQR